MSKISLHGLGFIQVELDGPWRLHVWDKDLPRRKNVWLGIHNHRFGFVSHILKGRLTNVRYNFVPDPEGNIAAYDHPPTHRESTGSRPWVKRDTNYRMTRKRLNSRAYVAGEEYSMMPYDYHATEAPFAVTVMRKLHTFEDPSTTMQPADEQPDPDFDRFQLSEKALWAWVTIALNR